MVGNIDSFDGQQNLEEWIRMVERTAAFTGWSEDNTFKAALFRLRGEASEHIEQLRAEGHITSWEDTKRALRSRYETSGREQFYQHLLNTGTQGNKTVQEWAQVVRKLSLKALGASSIKTDGTTSEGTDISPEQVRQHAAEEAANKAVLNFMRKTNFIRGLRSSLRQAVWRKKCDTFDEAVTAAAEEEAVEMALKEEEVLACYQGQPNDPSITPLVNSIVAALEAREATKEAQQSRQHETETRYRHQDAQQVERGRRYAGPSKRGQHMDYAREGRHSANYDDQLPLPTNRAQHHYEEVQDWRNQRPAHQGRSYDRSWFERERTDRTEGRCYYCHRQGHFKSHCPARMSGNGPRRLK